MRRLSTRRPVNSQRGWQWATTVAALAGGAATLTATSFRLACDEGSNSRLGPAEWGKANFNQTWNKIKTTMTPSSALVMQQQLEEWNKSFDELVLLAQRLYSELSFAEESLARHIVDHDRKDVQLHPELEWDAHVRIGDQPCFQERAYVRTRQRRIRESFARLLEIDNAEDIDPRDLPIFGQWHAYTTVNAQTDLSVFRRRCIRGYSIFLSTS